jgi:hypothetical protein
VARPPQRILSRDGENAAAAGPRREETGANSRTTPGTPFAYWPWYGGFMHRTLLAAAVMAVALFLTPASADASCCGQATNQMKDAAPCCADHAVKAASKEIELLLPLENDPQLNPAPPARQQTEVWFQRPVMVGRNILQGRYVIEHDNDRMARGEPCTYIYAYNDRTKPVVAFHCTHLERDPAGANTALLATMSDGSMQQLLEFQFAGESAAHGVPSGR